MGLSQRVLVVDDEEDVRHLVTRMLTEAGYEVAEAQDGAEAIERLKASVPDLVLLDLMMPGVDGWGVLEYLQATGASPPVVVLTARGDTQAFARSVSQGIRAYVYKPFRFADLLATCQRVLVDGAKPAADVSTERRRELRRSIVVSVRVLSRDGAPLALGELLNLSPGGAQVELGVPLEPGRTVWVAFQGAGINLALECRVQWWRGSATRSVAHGLSFANLAPPQEAAIRELLFPTELPTEG